MNKMYHMIKVKYAIGAGFILLGLAIFLPPLFDESDPVVDVEFNQRVRQVVNELIDRHFPLLIGQQLQLSGIQSHSVFLATDIQRLSLLFGSRNYVLLLNPELQKQQVPDSALTAILVHELQHFNDYQQMHLGELLLFYLRILTDEQFAIEYERHTDINTLELGYADGLIEFRQWQYPLLSDGNLQVKQKHYLRPQEIQQWLSLHANFDTGR